MPLYAASILDSKNREVARQVFETWAEAVAFLNSCTLAARRYASIDRMWFEISLPLPVIAES